MLTIPEYTEFVNGGDHSSNGIIRTSVMGVDGDDHIRVSPGAQPSLPPTSVDYDIDALYTISNHFPAIYSWNFQVGTLPDNCISTETGIYRDLGPSGIVSLHKIPNLLLGTFGDNARFRVTYNAIYSKPLLIVLCRSIFFSQNSEVLIATRTPLLRSVSLLFHLPIKKFS